MTGDDQPKVSAPLSRRRANLSSDPLIRLSTALGQDVREGAQAKHDG